jgi:hypothetical protein
MFESKKKTMKTPIVIRAIASGGKFIGDLVGGYTATVTVAGQTPLTLTSSGSSGNTNDLMLMQRLRTNSIPTNPDTIELPAESAAAASGELDIDTPQCVTISVTGPNHFAGQTATVSTTAWLLPGIGLVGDAKYTNGIVVELPGLLVQKLTAQEVSGGIYIEANITMMCGCKIIDNNGIWVSTDFVVFAQIMNSTNTVIAELPLNYVPYPTNLSNPSLFNAIWKTGQTGASQVRVIAYQRSMANTGTATTTIS